MKKLIITLTIFMCSQVYSMTESDYRTIFTALSKVESNHKTHAHNKREDARGIVQIRSLYLQDANEYLKTNYSHSDCYSPRISFILFKAYMKRYGAKTFEECAKLHNGGWDWRNKPASTGRYWVKVQKVLYD